MGTLCLSMEGAQLQGEMCLTGLVLGVPWMMGVGGVAGCVAGGGVGALYGVVSGALIQVAGLFLEGMWGPEYFLSKDVIPLVVGVLGGLGCVASLGYGVSLGSGTLLAGSSVICVIAMSFLCNWVVEEFPLR